jgi:IPT/TIG domain
VNEDLAGGWNGDLAYAGAAASRYGQLTHAGNADSAYDGAATPPAPVPPDPGPEPPSVPDVTFCYPSAGPATGGMRVTISGTALAGAIAVAVGPPVTSFTAGSDTQITAITAPGPPGKADVTVTGPGGTGTLPGGYRYDIPPSLDSADPGTGPAGTKVTLAGVNLASASEVTFGGARALIDEAADATITCYAPDGVPDGPADIEVMTAMTLLTLPGGFTYQTPAAMQELHG